jgi:chromosomal replication initiation ATPase DnaA
MISAIDIMLMVSAYLKIEKPSLIGNSTSRQYYIARMIICRLCDYADLSTGEIAEALKCSREQVRYALDRFYEQIANDIELKNKMEQCWKGLKQL